MVLVYCIFEVIGCLNFECTVFIIMFILANQFFFLFSLDFLHLVIARSSSFSFSVLNEHWYTSTYEFSIQNSKIGEKRKWRTLRRLLHQPNNLITFRIGNRTIIMANTPTIIMIVAIFVLDLSTQSD